MLRRPAVRSGHSYLAGRPIFCVHRGGAKLAPENTLEAFRQSLTEWGADMLELDVRASADGRVVVIHDATVDRTTDGTGAVAALPWDTLRDLDAGARFLDLEGRATFAGKGVRLPLFDHVLEAFPRTRLNVEAKDERVAHPLAELIRKHGAAHRVLIAAEHERNRREVRGYPGPWGASRVQLRIFWALHDTPFSAAYTPKADVLQLPYLWKGRPLVTPRLLAEAHKRNIAVHVWTVDDEPLMRLLLELGVDGIQTDRPDVLARVLTEVTGRPPPPGLARHAVPAPLPG